MERDKVKLGSSTSALACHIYTSVLEKYNMLMIVTRRLNKVNMEITMSNDFQVKQMSLCNKSAQMKGRNIESSK